MSGGDTVTQASGAIQVNPKRLHDFGVSVGDDVHRHVQPQASQLHLVFTDGVRFGLGNPSADLSAALTAYQACLTGIADQLCDVIDTVSTLAASAQHIATQYASADALAAARADDVRAALESAAAAQSATWRGQPRTGPQ